MTLSVFDADGHVDEDNAAIAAWFGGEYANPRRPSGFAVFPSLDGWSRGILVNRGDPGRVHRRTDAAIWAEVLDGVGLDGSVLYPTLGLAAGLIGDTGYAVEVASAYNAWIEAEYTARDARLFAAALLPVQDPAAAAAELTRCVRERRGFVAGVLPTVTNGPHTYGHEQFSPLFEAAQRLGVPLALHGGSAQHGGLETYARFAKVHALSHPLPMLRQVTDIVLSGVFDAFPDVRVVCLECGTGWVPWWMDRLDHEAGGMHGMDLDLRHAPSHYFTQTDNLWVSFEAGERSLKYAIDAMGTERLVYSSDYGHETPLAEIGAGLARLRHSLDGAAAARLLGGNARRLYRLDQRPANAGSV